MERIHDSRDLCSDLHSRGNDAGKTDVSSKNEKGTEVFSDDERDGNGTHDISDDNNSNDSKSNSNSISSNSMNNINEGNITASFHINNIDSNRSEINDIIISEIHATNNKLDSNNINNYSNSSNGNFKNGYSKNISINNNNNNNSDNNNSNTNNSNNNNNNNKLSSKTNLKTKYKKSDNSFLNFHFEKPGGGTGQTGGIPLRSYTPQQKRNKAKNSMLSKETYLQAK